MSHRQQRIAMETKIAKMKKLNTDGWDANGEWRCPVCGTMIGKNLLGEKPFGLVREHIRMHV